MPRSKRNKQVELAKTKKRGLEWKKKLFEEVRSCVDSYSNVYVFSVNDMRNSKMKNVREQWKHSRFFIGKNKIMAMALGKFAEEEYKPNLHKVGRQIRGQRGLLFSNKSTEEVLSWFRSYSEGDYARSGNVATEDVKLSAGPLPMFAHSLEPYLRQLGLPTSLVKGVIHLVKDHEVCKSGDSLTPETAKILKLLGYEMAEFHITINCVWSQDGTFMQFTEDVESDAKEKTKKKRKSSIQMKVKETSIPLDVEEMEVEEDEAQPNASDSGSEDEAQLNASDSGSEKDDAQPNASDSGSEDECPELIEDNENNYFLNKVAVNNDVTTNTSTPKEKSGDVKENGKNLENCSFLGSEGSSHIKENIENLKNNSFLGSEKKEEKNSDMKESDENIKNGSFLGSKETGEIDLTGDTPKIVNRKQIKKSARQSRATKDKSKTVSRKDSLLKTPDIANSSQDSPIFRELRTRSVKVIRKKNK